MNNHEIVIQGNKVFCRIYAVVICGDLYLLDVRKNNFDFNMSQMESLAWRIGSYLH
jgi:hypothetical protein